MNEQPQPASLYVQIPYRDAPAALRWLEQAFGLTTTMEWPDDDGGIQHAEMRLGDAAFTVFSDRAGYVRPEPRGDSVGFGVAFTLASADEVDRIFDSAIAAGAVAVIEPTDTEWGNHRCRVRDPEGYEWTFGTHKPGVPAEWSDADQEW
ncbi:VOC family protein [Microbacterium ureisolvens]|uniref:VOC family protein n=1 Tax=Microbacterium ureisolvens TaxID=2781186 RepID=UPI00364387DF